MRTISTYDELIENVDTLKAYMVSKDAEDHSFACKLIRLGVCFVVHIVDGKPFFAPSRFIGYRNNTRTFHLKNQSRDGRVTNEVIDSIVGTKPSRSKALDQEYRKFCVRLGIEPRENGPFGSERRFWTLSATNDFERKVVRSLSDSHAERQKRLREAPKKPKSMAVMVNVFVRNPDVVAEVLLRAKGLCENCHQEAPFRRRLDNTPYLEVHHKVRLADGGDDTVTNAIALCPNCHRKTHYG